MIASKFTKLYSRLVEDVANWASWQGANTVATMRCIILLLRTMDIGRFALSVERAALLDDRMFIVIIDRSS